MKFSPGKILRTFLKVIAWIIGSVIFLVLLITLSTRLPFVQDFIKDKAITFFTNKTSTHATLESLYINFPSSVELNGLYIEDLQGDTLVYAGRLKVRTDLLDLLNARLSLDDITVRDLVGNVHNTESDSTFNYQFIIDSLAAPPADAPPDTASGGGFDFGVYGVDVENARIVYNDAWGGMILRLRVGELLADASVFDLNHSEIFVDAIHLNDADGSFRITKDLPESTDTTSSAFYVNGREVFVRNVSFLFEDEPGGIRVNNEIGQVNIRADSLNIVDQVYDAREITMLNTRVWVDLFSGGENDTTDTAEVDADSAFSLLASSEQITMGNVDFRFYDHSAPKTTGFDPMHLWVQQINLRAENVAFEDGYADGRIDHLSATENNGLVIRELSTTFRYGANASSLEALLVRTARSRIEGTLEASYPSLEEVASDPAALRIRAALSPARIDLRDVTYFVPDLKETLPPTLPEDLTVTLQGQIRGRLNDLSLENIVLTTLSDTRLSAEGSIQGLPEIENIYAELPRLSLETMASDLQQLLPDTLLPENITLPDTISLTASLRGGLSAASGTVDLETSSGEVATRFDFRNPADSLARYEGNLSADQIEIGRITGNPDLGPVSMEMDFNGTGLELQTMESDFEGYISSVGYLGYSYDTIHLDAQITAGEFDGQVRIEDPNLNFSFNGIVGFADSVNTYTFDLDVEKADLRELGFSETEFQLLGNVDASISGSSIDDMNGYVRVSNTYINREGQIMPVDSLDFRARSTEDTTAYNLYSRFLEADFYGTFDVSILPEVIRQHFSKYYALDKSDTLQLTELRPQSFQFNVNVKDPRLFTYFVPGLTELEAGNIHGEYNSEEWMLDLDIQIDHVLYSGLTADSVNLTMNSDELSLDYALAARRFVAGPVPINNILLNGDVESDRIMTELHILDEEREDRYLFGGIFISYEDHYRFMFTPGKFIANYNEWNVKPSNSIDFFPGETWVRNLFLTYQEQEMRIFSEVNQRQDSVLNFNLDEFRLDQFGQITEDSVALLSGTMNGSAELNMVSRGLAFTSDLEIRDLGIKGDTLGNLRLDAETTDGFNYVVDLSIRGEQNDIKLTGNYEADSLGTLDMRLDINRLALSTIEAAAAGQLEDMSGYLTGDLTFSGSLQQPDFDGSLSFNEVGLRTVAFGALIQIDNERLSIDNNGLHFNRFRLTDEQGDPAILNGDITTKDFLVFNLDMQARLRSFKVINRPLPQGIPGTENPFYGNLDVISEITIRGNSVQPRIDLEASFAEGSSFAYVIPEETLTEQEQKDVVQWFDQDIEEISFFNEGATRQKDSVQQSLQGIRMSARINVDPSNELTIVIDPVTGDALSVKGNANLNYDIRPSGTQTLSGRFEVTEGSYVLNFYNLIRREFSIQEGSYILWTGDPLNAIMNVTAVYEVRASPVGISTYQGKLDFLVFLDIGGQLLQPEISFRLGLSPEAPAPIQVEAWVNQQNAQEERVNRQVFGLLLFQTFFPDDSYANAGNVNVVENTARSSVSRLLSSQLTRFSNQIEGLDLSIDIDSYQDYNASGETFGRTELELGVSKELFNQRVVVKLAGNVDLEGNRSRQGVSDFAGDIQIEYKLTDDGRFRLIGFRNNDFDNLQGEIIRTGVGVIYVREYNAFKELFNFGKEEQQEESDEEASDQTGSDQGDADQNESARDESADISTNQNQEDDE